MTSTDSRDPHARHHSHDSSPLLERLLDLDAHVHAALLDEAMDAVSAHVRPEDVHRVLDVGSGTGTGTFRWAARHPDADVIALDAQPAMAHRLADRAAREGTRRVSVVNRPVTATGLAPGSVDLAWASSVFHEIDEPARAFAELSDLLRPGGVLAIMEMDAPPRVLPDEHDASETRLRRLAHADAPSPDWTAPLAAAGFELLERRTLASDQELPADGPGGAYARAELGRLAHHSAAGLTTEETTLLSRLLADDSPLLPTVRIRGTRSLWIARRP